MMDFVTAQRKLYNMQVKLDKSINGGKNSSGFPAVLPAGVSTSSSGHLATAGTHKLHFGLNVSLRIGRYSGVWPGPNGGSAGGSKFAAPELIEEAIQLGLQISSP